MGLMIRIGLLQGVGDGAGSPPVWQGRKYGQEEAVTRDFPVMIQATGHRN